MGCNTSSEAKAKEEKNNAKENNTNAATEEEQKKSDSKDQPLEEQAATKIQAAFRGHQTRKSMSMKAVSKKQEPEPEPTRAELEAEFRADDKVPQTALQIGAIISVILNETAYPVDLCHAATKIQASFRGHQARKESEAQKEKEKQDKEDIEKIDLTDPDLNKAATKIQASFRGHKVRKDVPN